MSESPWASDDAQPVDFDEILESIEPSFIETHPGDPDVKVRALVELDPDVAATLGRISAARGEDPGDVIAQMVREAERSAAA
jgi:hypothetical protein